MTSKRLPGKVLRPLGGKPMLAWTIARLREARKLTHVILATSDHPSDDPLAQFCASEGVDCFRGPLDDVAGRFAAVLRVSEAQAFVRICGDSPLVDPAVVDRAINLYQDCECDVATNTQFRSFPKGQSVEVVSGSTFLDAYRAMHDPEDLEHVTRYFYRNPDRYRIVNFESGERAGEAQLSVDTEDDFASIEQVLAACGWKPGGWHELWRLKSLQGG